MNSRNVFLIHLALNLFVYITGETYNVTWTMGSGTYDGGADLLSVTFKGSEGQQGPLEINPDGNYLSRDTQYTAIVSTTQGIGSILQLRFDKGGTNGIHIIKVEVDDLYSNRHWLIDHDFWLDDAPEYGSSNDYTLNCTYFDQITRQFGTSARNQRRTGTPFAETRHRKCHTVTCAIACARTPGCTSFNKVVDLGAGDCVCEMFNILEDPTTYQAVTGVSYTEQSFVSNTN